MAWNTQARDMAEKADEAITCMHIILEPEAAVRGVAAAVGIVPWEESLQP